MGISLLTALIIQGNPRKDIIADCRKGDNGKWEGWIMFNEGNYVRPLLNTQAIYKNKKEALKEQNRIIDEIRKADISKEL